MIHGLNNFIAVSDGGDFSNLQLLTRQKLVFFSFSGLVHFLKTSMIYKSKRNMPASVCGDCSPTQSSNHIVTAFPSRLPTNPNISELAFKQCIRKPPKILPAKISFKGIKSIPWNLLSTVRVGIVDIGCKKITLNYIKYRRMILAPLVIDFLVCFLRRYLRPSSDTPPKISFYFR